MPFNVEKVEPGSIQEIEPSAKGLLVIICAPDPYSPNHEFWRGVMYISPETSRLELKKTLEKFRASHDRFCTYPTLTPHSPNQLEFYPLP